MPMINVLIMPLTLDSPLITCHCHVINYISLKPLKKMGVDLPFGMNPTIMQVMPPRMRQPQSVGRRPNRSTAITPKKLHGNSIILRKDAN